MRHFLVFLCLVGLFAGASLSCSTNESDYSTVTPATTIDYGKYSQPEVTFDWDAYREWQKSHATPTIAPDLTSAEAIAAVRSFLLSRAITIPAVRYVTNLDLTAYYKGNHVWSVGNLLLYENVASVVPNGSGGNSVLNRISRLNEQ